MKKIIFIAFIVFTSISLNAQNNSQTEIAESTKAIVSKISQELNFDNNETMYLQRALYATEETRQKAKDQLSHNPEQLNAINEKIDKAFDKMLIAKFSDSEIISIKQLVAEEKE